MVYVYYWTVFSVCMQAWVVCDFPQLTITMLWGLGAIQRSPSTTHTMYQCHAANDWGLGTAKSWGDPPLWCHAYQYDAVLYMKVHRTHSSCAIVKSIHVHAFKHTTHTHSQARALSVHHTYCRSYKMHLTYTCSLVLPHTTLTVSLQQFYWYPQRWCYRLCVAQLWQ